VLSATDKPGVKAILGMFPTGLEDVAPNRTKLRAPLTAWIGLDPSIRWRRHCYANLPDRLKPSPLNLIFKDLASSGQLSREAVRFQVIDFDLM
jgi:hypothetical protein